MTDEEQPVGGTTLKAVFIGFGKDLDAQLRSGVEQAGDVEIRHSLDHYPNDTNLTRLLRLYSPQMVFLSFESASQAAGVARNIEARGLGIQLVGVGQEYTSELLMEAMRAGIREFLSPPFDQVKLAETLRRISELLGRTTHSAPVSDQVFAFMPAKAGVGCSTITVNVAATLAETPGSRVLLADFDVNSGLVGFMLKLQHPYTVKQALEHAEEMDERLFRQLVASVGNLDVLPAGELTPGIQVETAEVLNLLDFVRRDYKAICIDLSGNLEKFSVEIMHEAKRIFLICTAELPALHLAREKLSLLRKLELEDQVSLILNRAQKRQVISTPEIEQLLGLPVEFTFPNDYIGVHKALAAGKRADPASELGQRFRAMASALLSKEPHKRSPKHRFVEYFSLLPARYSLTSRSK